MMPESTTRFTPEFIARWGYDAVLALVSGATLLVLALAYLQPTWVLFVPVLLAIGAGVAFLVRRPVIHLASVLASFVVISGHASGIQIQEAVYGIYYLGFLSVWFLNRFLTDPSELIRTRADKALAFFLAYATASVVLTVLFGGTLGKFAGEWLSISMLAFYWPVRHYCARDERGAKWMLAVLVWFALYGTVRNLLFFQEALQSAEQMWALIRSRVKLNEIFFLVGSTIGVVGSLYARDLKYRASSLVLFSISFASLLLTRSRGYWAAFGVAIFVIFFLVDARRKAVTLGAAGLGIGAFVLVGALLFPAYFELVSASLIQRLSTFSTAFTQDISLINRMFETRAVLSEWIKNPILGYGMGTPYSYFYVIPSGQYTMSWPFVHNGYAGLLYKFGLLGFGAMTVFYLSGVKSGIRLFRDATEIGYEQSIGLICAAFLVGEMLVANTSNPFIISDGNLLIAMTVALAIGCRERVEN